MFLTRMIDALGRVRIMFWGICEVEWVDLALHVSFQAAWKIPAMIVFIMA